MGVRRPTGMPGLYGTPMGGGGAAYTPLAPGADPAGQSLASGVTSSSSITFSAPTGGSGSYSYGAVLAHEVGSGAILSGSGLGPYTVSSLADGDVVRVTLTATDTGPVAQEVTSTAVVEVQTATTGGAWTVSSYDATAVPNQGPYSSGTYSISDGTTSIDWTISIYSGSGHTVEYINGTGIRCLTSGAGSIGAVADIAALIASYGLATYQPGMVFLGMAWTNISLDAASEGILSTVSKDTSAVNGNNRGLRFNYASASTIQPRTRQGTTDNNYGSAITTPTALSVGFVIKDANTIYGHYVSGTTTIPTPETVLSSGTVLYGNAVGQQSTNRHFDTVLNLIAVPITNGSGDVVEIQWGTFS